MKELLKKDLKIKIISVLAAIVLWLIVFNYDNPMQNQPIYNVQLDVKNLSTLEDKDLLIKNDFKKTIDITIRGRQEVLDKVRSSDFVATLDFSKVNSPDDKTVSIDNVYTTLKDAGIEIVSYTPSKIPIEVVRIKENTFPVEVIPNVTLKPDYKVLDIRISQDSLMLEGEEADIDSVAVIRGQLDIKDLDKDTTKRVDLKVYSKSDKVITSLSKNLSVDVTVRVAKVVPLNLVVTGVPNENYVEISRSVSPSEVQITGAPEILNSISSLNTEPISIDNIKQDLNTTGIIKLPEGVKLANQPKEVAVNIDVEQLILKDITVEKTVIAIKNSNEDPELQYEVKTESAVIQVKGRTSMLNTLQGNNLQAYVDVAGLEEGTHKLPLNIILPTQVKLMTPETIIEVKVTRIKTEETEQQ